MEKNKLAVKLVSGKKTTTRQEVKTESEKKKTLQQLNKFTDFFSFIVA